ncbi:MAG: MBL fold metallo-hydrolase [Thermodesulfobacteriota bacterium]
MRLFDDLYAFPWQSFTENNCNSYLIEGPFRVLIDPGHQHLFYGLRDTLASMGIGLEDIRLVIGTHMHPDHIEAVQSFAPLSTMTAIHEQEYRYFQDMVSRSDQFSFDFFLTEGSLMAGNVELEVIHTPGHSPGSVSIYWPFRKVLFAGDVIFEQGVGRTDLPGGNSDQLKNSIERLSSLDIEFLLPGHGSIIQGKDNVARNFSLVKQVYFGLL